MKKSLLAIGALLALTTGNAQIFSEDWSTAQATTWTSTQNVTDTDTNFWRFVGVLGFESQGTIRISESWIPVPTNDPGTALTPDNVLISPPINMSAISGNVSLSFKTGSSQATADGYFAEQISVYAVTDLATLPAATPIYNTTFTAGGLNTVNLAINSMAGQATVYLVFRHHNCTNQYLVMLDDILVTNGGVGIEENVLDAVVYPNPANDVLNINATEDLVSINVITMDGKVVATSTTTSVNVAALTSGMYLFEAVTVSGKVARGSFAKN
jgi:hypothetical protein